MPSGIPPVSKQPGIFGLRVAMRKKVTRRTQFLEEMDVLEEMDAVVPWTRTQALTAPHTPKAKSRGGRPPMLHEKFLRIPAKMGRIERPGGRGDAQGQRAFLRFAGIESVDDRIPERSILTSAMHLHSK